MDMYEKFGLDENSNIAQNVINNFFDTDESEDKDFIDADYEVVD